ncbi:MAG: nitrite/sulfite reductase [Candidatus Omnitrophica bacterium]|nr:nitrite/sulfite reductase [Candidatus Omnitrophota bacterium]
MSLDVFHKQFDAFLRGEIGEDEFKPLRTIQGVYSLRGEDHRYFIRIKLAAGILVPDQMMAIADMMDRFKLQASAHITTRQGIEIYGIRKEDLMSVLSRIEQAGLTSFATGGGTVRGVTTCSLAGVARNEAFDVTPYALVISNYFLRNPVFQKMPRKIKIAFEGCDEDHVKISIQDIGISALTDSHGKKFFRVYVGGGLGSLPVLAQVLEDKTELELLLPTVKAILRIFNERGNRQNRSRARLKYLIADLGIDEFRRLVLEERIRSLTSLFRAYEAWGELPGAQKSPNGSVESRRHDQKFNRWLAANVYFQKQRGYAAVFVRCPLGNLTSTDFRVLAEISREFSGGNIRTTISQNMILRWVHESDLVELYDALNREGLASCCAEQITDITRCASADACLSALTSCRGLAVALEEMLSNGFGKIKELASIRVNVSGCPNSCGQHQMSDIGFHGLVKRAGEHSIPCYRMFVGGRAAKENSRFGKFMITLPARRVPQGFKKVLEFFLKEQHVGENFEDFVQRLGIEKVKSEIATLEEFSSADVAAEQLFKDLGSDVMYRVITKRGEC